MERNNSSFLNFIAIPVHTILAGMGLQALIAGSLAALGVITLTPLQQGIASGIFLIIVFLVLLFTGRPYWAMMGMSLQALVSTVFAITHIMSLSIMQQYYFVVFYACVLGLLWLVSKIKVREDSWNL